MQTDYMKNLKYGLAGAALVGLGIFAGFRLSTTIPQNSVVDVRNNIDKLEQAVWYIEKNYVTTPDSKKLVDDAITGMLEGLDPHSFYIPADEMKQMKEEMSGGFDGIGVEFNILEDTIYIVSPIAGGPSEQLGIQAGDRIVKVDDKNVAGIKVTNNDVMKLLKGPKGTKVKVTIVRRGVKKPLEYTITRDRIPLYSVDYSYMIRPNVGYIKVSRFAETTYEEFMQALTKLKSQGMKSLVLDLRGNPGGYLSMAVEIADEFLSDGRKIVYTEGRIPESKDTYTATERGAFEKGPLVVLIDYGSASASEIVSGAIQDWDRGLIVGVRSFGKGLVQNQKEFADGSAMRLVISKYFTPSGRCIQKPYDLSNEEYENELLERFKSGEIYDASKIKFPDSLKFNTNSGRSVYGGGGVMPDFFVPRDTSSDSDYLTSLISSGAFREFSFNYSDQHPNLKTTYATAAAFSAQFPVNDVLLDEFVKFAEKKDVKFDANGFKTSRTQIGNWVKAFIGRRLYNDDGFYPTFHQTDNVLIEALKLLPKAEELEKNGNLR